VGQECDVQEGVGGPHLPLQPRHILTATEQAHFEVETPHNVTASQPVSASVSQ
jgi:hypothetical protein